MRTHSVSSLLMVAALFALAACDSLPDWMGGGDKPKPRLEGDRLSVLDYSSGVKPDAGLAGEADNVPEAEKNADYTHKISPLQDGYENIAISGFSRSSSARVGGGASFKTNVIAQPVVGNNRVFAMDAEGVISAHDAGDVSNVLWRSETVVPEDAPNSGGGGLAYANGVVYVTTGYGVIAALVAEDGSLLWRRTADVPVRAAPIVEENRVFAVAIDNQLLAFEARTGAPLWSHRGIRESAVYLGAVSPSVENGIVVVAYTSGEVYALRAEDGSALWSDSLILPRRTSAASLLTGINATPIIKDNVVYTLGNSGLLAANTLASGNGVWDLQVSGYNTPWIAGEYLYLISSDKMLMAIHRRNGLVKWMTSLRQLDGDKDVTPYLNDPIMINGQIGIVTDAGELQLFTPADGKLAKRLDIGDGVRVAPVVAGGTLYLLSSDATLTAYR